MKHEPDDALETLGGVAVVLLLVVFLTGCILITGDNNEIYDADSPDTSLIHIEGSTAKIEEDDESTPRSNKNK